MKGLFIATVTLTMLFNNLVHAQPAAPAPAKTYCQTNPDVCNRAAAWCAKHERTSRACKDSQESYCSQHEDKCKTGN